MKDDFTKDLDEDILEDLEELTDDDQDYSKVPGRNVLDKKKRRKRL